MGKKIGIITIQSLNFGNRLQNYALQEILKLLGFDVYTLKRYNEVSSLKKRILSKIKVCLQYCIHSKIVRFKDFNRNIRFSKYSVGANKFPAGISKDFDYFVTGSDQVWNPYFESVGGCDLLCFAESNQRVSYAASFGIADFPEDKVKYWGSELDRFKAISVREEEGKAIVEKISNKSAQIVLDPTLLLDGAKWEEVEVQPRFVPDKPYIFVYALKEKNEAFKNYLSKLSEKYTIVDILQRNKFGISPKLGPGEFVYLIHHAEYVLTDSFHATVFSIIFRKNVHTFTRTGMDMSSRINSLAKLVGLKNNFDNDKTFYFNPSVDTEIVQDNLSYNREQSISFLSQAFK